MSSEGATQTNPTPFQSPAGNAADTGLQEVSSDEFPDGSPPFQNSRVLPAGTLLTVSLQVPLVARNGSKQAFEAALDDPVILDGMTLIARDARISGWVESAQISKVSPERGYMRLTLKSVQIEGSSVPLQTASLFARQVPSTGASSGTIRLEKGRRLTFRLREPVYLHPDSTKASTLNP